MVVSWILKAHPPEATPPAMLSYLERERFLRTLGAGEIDLAGVSPERIGHLSQLVRRYEVRELKRFAPNKRWSRAFSATPRKRSSIT